MVMHYTLRVLMHYAILWTNLPKIITIIKEWNNRFVLGEKENKSTELSLLQNTWNAILCFLESLFKTSSQRAIFPDVFNR